MMDTMSDTPTQLEILLLAADEDKNSGRRNIAVCYLQRQRYRMLVSRLVTSYPSSCSVIYE